MVNRIQSPYFILVLFLLLQTACGRTPQSTPPPTATRSLPTVQPILGPKATEISATVAAESVVESPPNTPSIEPTDPADTPTQSVLTVGDLLAQSAPDSATEEPATGEAVPEPTAAPAATIPPTSTAIDISATTGNTTTQSTSPTTAVEPTATIEPTTLPTQTEPTLAPTVAVAASAPTPSSAPNPLTAANPPNELGSVLVLEYHLIEPGEDSTYSRTPQSVLADLEWLYANDYYPIQFRHLAEGTIDIPAGKSPVVLAFDDSSIGQYRILADGTVDPTSAMGIIMDFAERHADFPPIITAFPLLDVDVPSRILWGQPELANQKLRTIVELGGEIGSHTVSHERFDWVDDARIQWQLAHSAKWLEERIGDGYKVKSLALPLGVYPSNEALLRTGESEGFVYTYSGAAEVAGGPAFSPFSSLHDPYHIRRTQAVPVYTDNIFALLERRPTLKYVSDGDPQTITIPTEVTLDEEVRGTFNESAWAGYRVVRYDRN